MVAPSIPISSADSVADIETYVSAAVSCDPTLLRMMNVLRFAHARGVDPDKFARLLRLAIESAYMSGIQCGLNAKVKL
jgi:hypothetical protein